MAPWCCDHSAWAEMTLQQQSVRYLPELYSNFCLCQCSSRLLCSGSGLLDAEGLHPSHYIPGMFRLPFCMCDFNLTPKHLHQFGPIPVSRVGWDPSKHSLLNTCTQTAVWGHLPAVVLWLIQREKQFLPTVVIFNTIVDRILAHPGISAACAAMQGSFNIHAALIRSLALAHEQHLRHIAGHAPIEALCCLLASIRLALVRHAGLKNRR